MGVSLIILKQGEHFVVGRLMFGNMPEVELIRLVSFQMVGFQKADMKEASINESTINLLKIEHLTSLQTE